MMMQVSTPHMQKESASVGALDGNLRKARADQRAKTNVSRNDPPAHEYSWRPSPYRFSDPDMFGFFSAPDHFHT
jgi:hypothetical protein